MFGKHETVQLPDVNEIDSAMSSGDRSSVIALFKLQQAAYEKALQKREADYATLIDTLTDGIIRFGHDFRIIFINLAAARIMGISRDELIGKTPLEIPLPMYLIALWQGGIKQVLDNNCQVFFEYEFDNPHKVHSLQISMIPETDSNGQTKSVLTITRDISENKQADVALRESEERFNLVLGSAPLTVFFQDRSLHYTGMFSSHPNWTAESFLSRTDHDIFPFEEAEQLTVLKRKVMQSGQSMRGEYELTYAAGKVWIDVSIAPHQNHEGEIIGVAGVALDITERKKVEKILQVNEERFHSVLDYSRDIIYRMNLETGYFEYISPSVETVLGYSPDELIHQEAKAVLNLIHPDDVPRIYATHTSLIGTGKGEGEYRFLTKGGSYRWISSRSTLIKDSNGLLLFQDGYMRDITESKQAEEKLRESERIAQQRLNEIRTIYYSTPIALCVLDTQLRFVRLNDRLAENSGIPAKEHIGKTVYEMFPNVGEKIEPVVQKILRTGKPLTEVEISMASKEQPKELRYFKTWWSPIKDVQGQIAGFSVGMQEITENKKSEMEIARLRKQQEAFLRHEVKNLIGPLQLFSEVLLMDTENLTQKQKQYLRNIAESAGQVMKFTDAVRQIHDFEAGNYHLQLTHYPLENILTKAIQNLKLIAENNGVILRFRGVKKVAMVKLDQNFLPGVFTNLILNAIEHVAGLKESREKVVKISLTGKQEWYVVKIINRGAPIPPERLETFFEKYNSGPEKHNYTGLGTTYAWLVTKAHGGDITITSNRKDGTTVSVVLPVSPSELNGIPGAGIFQ